MTLETYKIKLRREFEGRLFAEAQEALGDIVSNPHEHLIFQKKGIWKTKAFKQIFNEVFNPKGISLTGWAGDDLLVDSGKFPDEIKAIPEIEFVGKYPDCLMQ